jgi:aryl-alcohol dehydrogenase-like predicted oxidoreductase
MEKRTLGKTPVEASVIAFGAWAIGGWLWGGADRKDARDAILASFDNGVTSIDTAPAYGQGLSEEIVGEAMQEIGRHKIQLFTKFGLRWDIQKGDFYFSSKDNAGRDIKIYKYASKDSVIKECENSLKRLKTDYIDLYQIHTPDKTTPIAETMEAMQRLLEQGKIKAAGVSNYSAAQMREAEKTITLASNQVPYSMVLRDIEQEVTPYCRKRNIAILAYSPLQRGLLTGKIKPGHRFNAGDSRADGVFYEDENILRINKFLEKLRTLADNKKATLGQLVIRWTIEQPGITVVLVGARNRQQAIENAKASDICISSDQLAFIDGELGKLELIR